MPAPRRLDPTEKSWLCYGDNLEVLREHVPDRCVDLVYLDPPFNSNRSYSLLFREASGEESQAQMEAFDDTWHWTQESEALYEELLDEASARVGDALEAMRRLLGDNDVLAYLVMMTARLRELHRVLTDEGVLVLHCDPVASHYLKIMLDAIFGPDSFVNEIIWQRTSVKGDARRKFGAVHDVLLAYAKSGNHTFNPVYGPKGAEYTARFRLNDDDGKGPYRLAPLDSPNPRPNLTYEYKGYQPPAKGWRVSREVMERLDADGLLAFPRRQDGRIARKHYLADQPGPKLPDVWTDIAPLQASSAERLGYPTQKPLVLLDRVIQAFSNEGDVVLDPFCGCGTAVASAQRLGRRWIGIDVTTLAVDLIDKRMRDTYGDEVADGYEMLGIPRDVAGAAALFRQNPFDFERWAVSLVWGQPNERQVGDRGIDGVVRFPLGRGERGRALVSVKGGASNPGHVRDLLGTVQTQRAEMGLFVCMNAPTRGMVEAADTSGSWVHPANGQRFPKVQIITVADLLEGRRPQMPPAENPYSQARRSRVPNTDEGLF